MNKKIIYGTIFLIIALILIALLLWKILPDNSHGGGCHFGVVDSVNQSINNAAEIPSVLAANGWQLNQGLENETKEINFTQKEFPSQFINDTSLRYWKVYAHKNITENNIRSIDLIDENGRLYKFYNCV